MGKKAEYHGFMIESVPHREANQNKWQLHILISVQHPGGSQTREFFADVLYATEEEADIHGIAFGQRIIDGKLDGWSVSEMKTPDRRAARRFRVQFRTTFSTAGELDGTGSLLDLSIGGCRIESSAAVTPGLFLEVRIHVPHLEWPLMVDEATVQWVTGQTFGLAFFRIKESERQRLEKVIKDLLSNSPCEDRQG